MSTQMVRLESASEFKGLSLEQVRKAAPSVFAKHPSPKMSDRYAFVPTVDLLEPLLEKGFIITHASQRATRARDPNYTRHMLRLRLAEVKPVVGDVFPEVVITNSHDGQSRHILNGGLFRLVCSNGMVTGFAASTVSFKHRGDAEALFAQSMEAVENSAKLKPVIKQMIKHEMTDQQIALFANAAAQIAYEEPSFEPKLLLEVRREQDAGNTLWKVFSRVQENVTRGGVHFVSRASGRAFTTRGITHIGRTVDFNQRLWQLAEDQLKLAA